MFRFIKRLIITLVVIALVVAIGLAALIGYSMTIERTDGPGLDIHASDENTRVFRALVAGGLSEAVVDITDQRALVRYNLPDGMTEEESWAYTLTMLSVLSSHVELAVVEVYLGHAPQTRVSVAMADLLDLANAQITPVAFGDRTTVIALD